MTNRRDFLKTSLTGAVAGLTLPAAFSASAAQANSTLPKKWDLEADVVVLGFGGAGATTAIVAAQNGASVVVLEKILKTLTFLIRVCLVVFSTARSKMEILRPLRLMQKPCSLGKIFLGKKKVKFQNTLMALHNFGLI